MMRTTHSPLSTAHLISSACSNKYTYESSKALIIHLYTIIVHYYYYLNFIFSINKNINIVN